MEVVLEAVELGTTDPFQNFDEMVVLLYFLSLFPNQSLVSSGDYHAVLAASISEARIDEYVCDSNVHELRSFVLLLSRRGGRRAAGGTPGGAQFMKEYLWWNSPCAASDTGLVARADPNLCHKLADC